MYLSLLNEEIIVTFTTTPYRINKIGKSVATITSQHAPIKTIYLNIPNKFKRAAIEYDIPAELIANKKLTVLRTQDYGPATKLLGLLEQIKFKPNTIIITLDDDVYYPKNLVLQLAFKAKFNSNKAIGISGANPNYGSDGLILDTDYLGLGLITQYHTAGPVDVLQGYAGIAYRAKFFQADIFDLVDYPQACILSDDVYFSYYLARQGITRMTLKNPYISVASIPWKNKIGTGKDALHQIGKPAHKHRECIAYMKQINPGVQF